MSTSYEPGTVAVATVNGVPDVRVFKILGNSWATGTPMAAEPGAWRDIVGDGGVADVRPLVVLDLDEAPYGKSGHYDQWLRNSADIDEAKSCCANQRPAFLRWLADQIEALVQPPRIPEPGLWGVVRAKASGGEYEWVRYEAGWTNHHGHTVPWASLADPILVHVGVEA